MATVTGCTFLDNAVTAGAGAGAGGGAIHSDGGGIGGGAIFSESASLTVSGCDLLANLIEPGVKGSAGGAVYHLSSGDITLDRCLFEGNTSPGNGGAVAAISLGGGAMSAAACTFRQNTAAVGGAVFTGFATTMLNTLMHDNDASSSGGGIRTFEATDLINCTMSGNDAPLGMAINAGSTPLGIVNTIVWNGPASIAATAATIGFSDVQESGGSGPGWDPAFGTDAGGNIDADPLFADRPGGDFRIAFPGPAVDAGSDAALPYGTTSDIDGLPRVFDGDGDGEARVDMGAHEAPIACPGDTDDSGAVDVDDLVAVVIAWGSSDPEADVDGSGTVDVDDLVLIILRWGPCTGS